MSNPRFTQFRRLALSNFAAQSAEQIGLAVTPLVAVLTLGANASQTGFLQAAQMLPFFLLSIPFGVWADRHSRGKIMLIAEIMRVLTLITVLMLLVTNTLTLPLLAVLGFLATSGTVAYSVAAPALIPMLVKREELSSANGVIELSRSIAYFAGPAVGGLLLAWIGAKWAYVMALMLSAYAALLLCGLQKDTPSNAPRRHFVLELNEGAKFVYQDRYLRPMIVTSTFFNIGFFTLQAVYVPFAIHHLMLSAPQVGMTYAATGFGMMCGAYFAPVIMKLLRFGIVFAIGPFCGLVASLLMVLSIFYPWFSLAMLSFFLLGFGPILWVIASTTLRQAITPPKMLGRVSALNSTATFGARPVGALAGAFIAGWFGTNACILAAVVSFIIQAAAIVLSDVPRLERIPDAPYI